MTCTCCLNEMHVKEIFLISHRCNRLKIVCDMICLAGDENVQGIFYHLSFLAKGTSEFVFASSLLRTQTLLTNDMVAWVLS